MKAGYLEEFKRKMCFDSYIINKQNTFNLVWPNFWLVWMTNDQITN